MTSNKTVIKGVIKINTGII